MGGVRLCGEASGGENGGVDKVLGRGMFVNGGDGVHGVF